MKNTKRKAFTLVELLVVIAIIGILFVVLISKVDFATEKSKASGVQTDFRSYQLAIETVARENAGLSTLVDDDASGEEKYAALEAALNKNLDPKLRVEIDADGKISTDAKDPWKEEYTGQYLAPDADGTVKDRGAIVMYCKGSNLKLGSTAEITNGVVNVTIESGKETEGADDYAISTIYTYVNGYGEIKTTTDGFSNDMGDENANRGDNTPINPGNPSNPTDPVDPEQTTGPNDAVDPEVPTDTEPDDPNRGEEPVLLAAGLYDANDVQIVDWETLTKSTAEGGYGMNVTKNYNSSTYKTDTASPYCVLTNNDMLKNGTKLIISNDIMSIGNYAFYSCSGLTSIDFGSGITNIGSDAFNKCSGLTNITIQNSVTSIGDRAFNGCSGLTGVYITDLVAWCGINFSSSSSNPICYAKNLYLNNAPITNLKIPDEITKIKKYTFYNAKNITGTLTIHENITSIGEGAFGGCSGLTGDFVIPNSVTYIGNIAFQNCSGLTNVTVSDSVSSIGNGAFRGCSGLAGVYITDLVAWCNIDFVNSDSNPLYCAKNLYLNNDAITNLVIPDTITKIKSYTFNNAQNITGTLTIHDDVTSIGKQAFSYCSGLTGITIGNSVTYIDNHAFAYCFELTGSITIPDSVTFIGDWAFYCFKLDSLYISDLSAWCRISFTSDFSNPLHCAKNLYLNNELITDLVIPEDITEIKEYTFYGANITSLTVHDRVTSIGSAAFGNCSRLANVTIGDGVTYIGVHAFSGCSGLMNIAIGKEITSIDDSAFKNCSGLTGVYITDLAEWCRIDFKNGLSNPLYYAKNLYLNNTPITNLVIPDEITEIKKYTFYNAQNITGTLTIPDSVTSIGADAFNCCFGLTGNLVIPDGVSSIGDSAFYDCSGLTSVVIGNGVTSIGRSAFDGCTGLTGSIAIPNSVISIGNYTFNKCSKLTSVTIGNGVTSIGDWAFGWCNGLNSFTINTSALIPYASYMFGNCKNLANIYVPADLVEQYKAADGWIDFADKIQAIPTT